MATLLKQVSATDMYKHESLSLGKSDALQLPYKIMADDEVIDAETVTSIDSYNVPEEIENENYDMNHTRRGLCIIFNNKKFESHTELIERNGTDIDAEKLSHCFRELDFEIELHHDSSVEKMLNIFEKAGEKDYTNYDCFICCILTHGEQNILYGSDGKFPASRIYDFFNDDSCPSLRGKPKMFFIQACQGNNFDHGVILTNDVDQVNRNRNPDNLSIPEKVLKNDSELIISPDFLIAYSTVPGFFSWRNDQGSWFIQTLCRVIEEYGRKSDIMDMLTVVSRKVCYDYESFVPDDYIRNRNKQAPCIKSTLRKKVYFPEKVH